jgi:hypothetical protein
MLIAIALLSGCSEESEKPIPEGPPVEVDWGSWELQTVFVGQDEICSDLGANGENLGTLYGEMEVGEKALFMSLGDMYLSGERDDEGFEMMAFREIPVNGADPDEFGIGAVLDGEMSDNRSFHGTLLYQLDFPNGYCEIEVEVDAYWMYYEPPPDCGG